MRISTTLYAFFCLSPLVFASPYHPDLVNYNLNVNKDAKDPTEYDSEPLKTTYTPSPQNWRALPTYTVLLDKFADGDPSNNDFFKSEYESDIRETQLRFGGDLKGLVSQLDYLHGMGIRVVFIAGTPFLNMIWQADSATPNFLIPGRALILLLIGYSPLDFSVLDPHWGTIQDWRDTIDAIHSKGMYFMADFTVGTMADLIGSEGYAIYFAFLLFVLIVFTRYRHLNQSTPFNLKEYNAVWKRPSHVPWNFSEYRDFQVCEDATLFLSKH
jgi:alpha-1,3-glucan synthase